MVPRHRRLLRLLAATALTLGARATASVGTTAQAAPGSPALTPPLGRNSWNSWNSFGCGITEAQVHQTADPMVSSAMKAAGCRYVVVGDCWLDPQRDAAGNLSERIAQFTTVRDALRATGRPIVYSIDPDSCPVGVGNVLDVTALLAAQPAGPGTPVMAGPQAVVPAAPLGCRGQDGSPYCRPRPLVPT